MKALLAAAMVMSTLLAGCQSPGPGAPAPHRKSSFKYGTGDGQTMATAVEIRTRSETEGGALVLDWIHANYPGHVIQHQELIEARDRAYNMVTLIGQSNTPRRLFFDISSYYRRLDNGNFPKPLP